MNDLRVGLIGFGYAGRTFHAPLIAATPGLRLAAVASSDAAKVSAALGPEVEVLSAAALVARADIDLVVIAAPNDRHHPLAWAALEAGRHVVVDKPFTLDVVQARELIAVAQRRGRLLSVFHNRRWDGDFLTLTQVVREGRLGRPVEFTTHFDRYRPEVRARWREGAGPGAGLWMDLGPHLLDQAVRLFGWPSAMTLDLATLRDGALADDWFCASLRWADGPHPGLRARLHASMLAAHPGPRFAFNGTMGSLVVEGLDPQETALQAGAGRHEIMAPDWGRDDRCARLWLADGTGPSCETLPLRPGAYPTYYAAVRDAVRGVGANPVPAEQALAVQALIDAGRQSARERRELDLSTWRPVPSPR